VPNERTDNVERLGARRLMIQDLQAFALG
jgi:hypothetical protein